MSMLAQYSIKDLEVLTGIRAATLRMWEKRYQVIKPLRTQTNIRYYNNIHLKALLNINVLNRNGIKISHIAKMSNTEIAEKVKDFSFVRSGDEDIFDGLMLSMIDLDEALFHQVFYKAVARLGFESTVHDIIFPFFSRIGVMWQIDAINPAQEHFMSNMVRQKLISAIDNLPVISNPSAKKITMFLPENELHELGMLFLNYVLRNRGYQVVYLGQAVPLSDLPKILQISNPDILICNISNAMSEAEASVFISRMKVVASFTKFYFASASIMEYNLNLPPNFFIFNNLKTLASKF